MIQKYIIAFKTYKPGVLYNSPGIFDDNTVNTVSQLFQIFILDVTKA